MVVAPALMVPLEIVQEYRAPAPALSTEAIFPVETAVTAEAVDIFAAGNKFTISGAELLLFKGSVQTWPPADTEMDETLSV